jgi:peptidyl-prolyl cis-trans isomerase SurA
VNDAARGLAIAQGVRDAVAAARDDDDFMAKASAATKAVRASVERLPPFDATGRLDDGSELDQDFVAGAFALHAPGEISPIVETPFGWHVIRLVARTTPRGADADARRAAMLPAVETLRARMRLADVLRTRRRSTRVEISAAAEELMSRSDAAP